MRRFQTMETFIKIVDIGSISGAADRLNVAKSAVSRRLKELEDHLGVELFHRTTRQLTLTDTGQAYYSRCIQLLDDLTETEFSVSQAHCELEGKLKVALPSTFGHMHMTPAINDFLAQHPGIKFDLDFNDRAVDVVQEGFDVAIRISRLADSSLIAKRLAPIRRVFCASPDYLRANGTPQVPDELADHDTLVYAFDQIYDTWVLQKTEDGSLEKTRVRLTPKMRATAGEFLRDAAASGQGIAFLPTFIIHKELENGQLVTMLDDYSTPEVNAYAIYPQTRHLSRRVRAFIDFLADRFSGTPYWDVGV